MSADPQNLGPYRIVRRIGAGGMGVVYEAVHTGLDKRVALKVLPRERASDRLERFMREARTAAALHHTNIVPAFDVGQVDGVPYFAMQFIDGRPLDAVSRAGTHSHLPEVTKSFAHALDATTDHVPADAPPAPRTPGPTRDPRAVVAEVLQASEGLAYAHDRGVVHRDIKPANLLLDASGVVWVADYGLAFRPGDPTMTADGAVIGTPRCMSPEQARGEKTDARTDVYSLGVTLYELLTGAVAFPGETVVDVLNKVLTHTPPPPRSLDRRVSADLDTVVTKAMAKRREDRYASGREFADDLKRYLNGEPVRARRIGPVGKAWRWSKRNPAVAALLTAVLLVFAVGAGVSAYFARQAERREGDARKNLSDSESNFRLFERQADLTIQALKLAQKREGELVAAGKQNEQLLYAARIGLAGAALRERNYDRVSEPLAETMPAAGREDPRRWEWHYLFRQVHSESRLLPFGAQTFPLYSGPARYVEAGKDVGWRVREYDAGTGELLRDRPGPPDVSWHEVGCTEDGRRLYVGNEKEVWVWDIEAAKEVARLKVSRYPRGHPHWVLSGDTFACVAPIDPKEQERDDGARCEVWNVATGKHTVLSVPAAFGPLGGG